MINRNAIIKQIRDDLTVLTDIPVFLNTNVIDNDVGSHIIILKESESVEKSTSCSYAHSLNIVINLIDIAETDISKDYFDLIDDNHQEQLEDYLTSGMKEWFKDRNVSTFVLEEILFDEETQSDVINSITTYKININYQ